MKLDVIDHQPHAWFLLRDGDDHYLDVNCSHGPVGFSLLVKLSAAEHEEYRALGRVFIDYLAARVAYWWSDYKERDLGSSLQAEVSDAVTRFRSR